ncbi:DUF2274 domain-containing protein [Polaromonas sp. A23]|uniref:DUF2274 domain-containing protein n=1 Tax=Polaromonas sp. A23 TaxID=1944133 RepID=UPI000985354E|nr:DUF2274 domain-containing protein [Polaromonas sp. A23]OOG36600.1 hypothetical protein B0B52_20045 [Polaromonas sp. A23]
MSNAKGKLGLGKLPRTDVVKVTIALTTEAKSLLDRYAAVHSQIHGDMVDAVVLIPHMLDAFMKRDRGFRALSPRLANRKNQSE